MKKRMILTGMAALVAAVVLGGCASNQPGRELDKVLRNKGTTENIPAPEWYTTFKRDGIMSVEALPAYSGTYCFVGEARGPDLEFCLQWAKQFSGQAEIADMVRTNVASQLKATQKGARDTGLENKIDNFVNVNVNVAYSGAQRVNDWWALVRHYDPDRKDVYKDEYEVYVFYTASKTMLNEAASNALATAASKDSDLYQITIDLARQIMLPGYDLRTGEAGTTVATLSVSSAAAQSAKTGRVALLSKNLPANFVSKVKIYSGTATNGEPYLTSTDQILPEREAAWNLPEGVYTFVLYYNNSDTAWGNATVTVTAGDYFKADIRTDWSFAFARK